MDMRRFRHLYINDKTHVSSNSLEFLLDNFREALSAKKVERLEGMCVDEWFSVFSSRVGKEPLFRLMYCFYRALGQSGVGLHELLCEEPAYFIECLNNNNYLAYHDKYNLERTQPAGPTGINSPRLNPVGGNINFIPSNYPF
jgi:hypothetical protein